jgi:hypothetical protein
LPSHTPICHHFFPSVIAFSNVPSLSPLYHCTLSPFYHCNLQLINQWNVIVALLGRFFL